MQIQIQIQIQMQMQMQIQIQIKVQMQVQIQIHRKRCEMLGKEWMTREDKTDGYSGGCELRGCRVRGAVSTLPVNTYEAWIGNTHHTHYLAQYAHFLHNIHTLWKYTQYGNKHNTPCLTHQTQHRDVKQ